jgi:hypothetical protein
MKKIGENLNILINNLINVEATKVLWNNRSPYQGYHVLRWNKPNAP